MPGVTLSSLPGAIKRSIHFDRSRLRWPEWVVGISALLLLIFTVSLSWYTFTLRSGGLGPRYFVQISKDGWNGTSHLHWLLLVTILAAFALFISQATRRAPAIPVTLSLFVGFLAGASTIWLLVRVPIDPPAGRDAGGWLALISAAVLTWAAWCSVRREGIAPSDAPDDVPTVTPADVAAERAARLERGAGSAPAEHS